MRFAQLKQDPSLFSPDLRSPIFHPDGTMTVLWEGDAGEGGVLCRAVQACCCRPLAMWLSCVVQICLLYPRKA